jgi:hypothetical protein
MEKSKCLSCGEPLTGRIDKKYCSDYCRSTYNNRLNSESRKIVRNINNKLKKNYRILQSINTDQKTKTTRDKLLSKGFNFNYFTSIYRTKTGNEYYFVYDQGYLALENDYFAIVKRD